MCCLPKKLNIKKRKKSVEDLDAVITVLKSIINDKFKKVTDATKLAHARGLEQRAQDELESLHSTYKNLTKNVEKDDPSRALAEYETIEQESVNIYK